MTETVIFEQLGAEAQELIKESARVRENSYSPYSKFKVGASVRTTNGRIYSGCNIENCSYSVTVCAEKSALCCAISDGQRKVVAVAVCSQGSGGRTVAPCGHCRQFISEFAASPETPVYMASPDLKKVTLSSVGELLPLSFTPNHLL